MAKLDILIVEDERSQREMLRECLASEGHEVAAAAGAEEALRLLQERPFDLLLLDYKMPGKSGLDLLREAKGLNPELDGVMLTAHGTTEIAVAAMKAGATDYLTKPIELDELFRVIERVSERRTLVRENEVLRRALEEKGASGGRLLYRSLRMAELVNLVGRVAPSKATVLIRGESGTGKELIAQLLHEQSPRQAKPLVTVNCAALPETLLESELFGHEKGAFTGAHQRRVGWFEQADGGTLFLDEIGELSPATQVKLLRFLQQREFQRVGGNQMLRADVRVVAATHQDLEAKVREGTFREDLFYRLNVITLQVPPLRERREDIPLLLDHFLERFAQENGKSVEGFSKEARHLLLRHDYPGNVRELENLVERAVVVARGPLVTSRDLPFQQAPAAPDDALAAAVEGTSLREAVEHVERRMIEQALADAGSNQSRAAESLGISERMLRYKLKKYRNR